jgi:hypothetical protein
MNQQSLATVILRILGLTYFYASITAFFSGNMLMQVMSLNDIYGEEKISLMAVVGSMVGIQSLLGIILMIFAGMISKVLFKENKEIIEERTLTVNTLIQAAVPIVGLYFVVSNLPKFLIVAVGWYQERASAPTGMRPQHGMEMAHYTIMMILSIFITLRSQTICRFLTRNTK